MELNAEQILKIKKLLFDPALYGWGFSLDCALDYGFMVAFANGEETLRVAICFKCGKIGVFDGSGQELSRISHFDCMEPELIDLVKALFPNDPEIQGHNK